MSTAPNRTSSVWWTLGIPALVLLGAVLWQFVEPALDEPLAVSPPAQAPGEAPAVVLTPTLALAEAPAEERLPDAFPAPLEEKDLEPPKLVAELERGELPWETEVMAVLDRPTTAAEKATQLLTLLPVLPDEALEATCEEAVARLRDVDYEKVAYPLMTNPASHGRVLSTLFSDLMERAPEVTLPTLLAIARQPQHPFAEAAHNNLNYLLGEDFEADWPAWEQAVQRRLETSNAE